MILFFALAMAVLPIATFRGALPFLSLETCNQMKGYYNYLGPKFYTWLGSTLASS